MTPKITYGREEGGFSVHVNGVLQGIWRYKNWMGGLRKRQEVKTGSGNPNYFLMAQCEYHGKAV